MIHNDRIQSKLAHSISLSRSNEPPPPRGSCIRNRVFLSLLNDLPLSTQVHGAWINGHAGFQGNEVSDYISNWAAHALPWHRTLTPPPPLGSITVNKRQSLRVPPEANIRDCLPKHEFADRHLAFSSDFYKHSSFFSAYTFKWASRYSCMSTYKPHWKFAQYLCPVCSQNHPLDPITFTPECPSMDRPPSAYIPGVVPPFKCD